MNPATLRLAGLLAAVAIAGLMIAFQQVVRLAVNQGQERRAATLAHSNAMWQCRVLRARAPRDDCLQQASRPGLTP